MRDKESYAKAGRLGQLASKESLERKHLEFVDNYNKNPKKCLFCSNVLPFEKRRNKFCSHSCAGSHNNIGVDRHIGHRDASLNKECEFCGQNIRKGAIKYCSQECITKLRDQEIIKRGHLNGSSGGTVRRFMKANNPNICSICGISEWQGDYDAPQPILLIVDHIDGNSTNNSLDNLRLVCSNCDATLATYKSKNINSGRQYRRDRYAAGKSY